ncbi:MULTISPECIES: DoxX family protein [Cupriavidus]|uniref:DoxX family protein n=1 Tax=Cupriavidus sp. DF5525 TaxID=3160989 RepID=UPI0003B01504|nr:DoxX protein [Ralstonia pickettii DTP0602]
MTEPTTSLTPASAGGATHPLPGWLRWLALLLLCAAYLQGGLVKLADFPGAIAEMQHFGLSPAVPMAIATIVLELGACAMILLGWRRWLGALALAAFTLAATFVANRFWQAPPDARFMMANAFFEHLGLVGGFLLVAWHDLRERTERKGLTEKDR